MTDEMTVVQSRERYVLMSVININTGIKQKGKTPQSSIFKIKAINGETGEFKEQLLPLATGTRGECLIGRHDSCDLVLDSAEVSRIHGRIWCEAGQCFFADLGSTDGSQIDDREVEINQIVPLNPHNLLRIGGFVLKLSPTESVTNAPSDTPQWSSGKIVVRCIQVIEETHDVKTFRFVAEPNVLFFYKPGQFVILELEIAGKKVMRSYSISSTPSRPHILEITVKRVPAPTDVADAPPGLVSNWLHENMTVGSQVQLKGPMGQFTCVDRQAAKLLFISAGSGITPMMSMSRWLCDRADNVDLIFVHSASSPHDFIFRHELESMAARYSNFKLAVTMTRLQPGQFWQGYTGRLNELMLQAIAPDLQERTIYVCGSNPFMDSVKTKLEVLNFPMENYYEESFGGAKIKPSAKQKRGNEEDKTTESSSAQAQKWELDTTKPKSENITSVKTTQEESPVAIFSKVGKEIPCDEEDTILEIAEQEGIELPSGCRMGACGSCKLPLLEGKVNYDDEPECEPGYLFTCIAKPVGRVVIEA